MKQSGYYHSPTDTVKKARTMSASAPATLRGQASEQATVLHQSQPGWGACVRVVVCVVWVSWVR